MMRTIGIVMVAITALLSALATRCTQHVVQLTTQPLAMQPSTKPVLTLKYSSWADLVVFSPDNRVLASTGRNGVRLTDVRTNALVPTIDAGHANSIAFSPDGRFLVIGTPDGKVKVLGVPTLVEEQILPVTQWSVYAVAVSPNSKLVAACAADGTVEVWEISSARKLCTLSTGGTDRMSSLAFSPDGKLLAGLTRYGGCNIWDLTTSKTIATVAYAGNENDQIQFSPGGNMVAVASHGTSILLWKYQTEKQPTIVKVPDILIGKPRINGFGFSPEEGRSMSAPLGDFACGRSSISPDMRIAACTLENGKTALWDIATRQVLCILPTGHVQDLHGGGVQGIAFSPNGQLLATANKSGDVEVWQLKGEPINPSTQLINADEIPIP